MTVIFLSGQENENEENGTESSVFFGTRGAGSAQGCGPPGDDNWSYDPLRRRLMTQSGAGRGLEVRRQACSQHRGDRAPPGAGDVGCVSSRDRGGRDGPQPGIHARPLPFRGRARLTGLRWKEPFPSPSVSLPLAGGQQNAVPSPPSGDTTFPWAEVSRLRGTSPPWSP